MFCSVVLSLTFLSIYFIPTNGQMGTFNLASMMAGLGGEQSGAGMASLLAGLGSGQGGAGMGSFNLASMMAGMGGEQGGAGMASMMAGLGGEQGGLGMGSFNLASMMGGMGGEQSGPGLLGSMTIAELLSILPQVSSNKNTQLTRASGMLSKIPQMVWNLPASQFIPLNHQENILKGLSSYYQIPSSLPQSDSTTTDIMPTGNMQTTASPV